jgi:hypothetical protein
MTPMPGCLAPNQAGTLLELRGHYSDPAGHVRLLPGRAYPTPTSAAAPRSSQQMLVAIKGPPYR